VKKLSMIAASAATVLLAVSPVHAQVQEADVTGGKVSGVVANGIVSFRGIPFAAPPVGELRWKAPQPLKPWIGVKQATRFGPSCVQDETIARILGATPEMSEDCLYLNVWTPAKAASDNLPVMVWIYGGGFVGGQTSVPLYEGTRLADKGIVLVSVAYRLGAFGFLAHPELSRESGKGSGNFGLQDQIASLQWVKANIAKFGGDPGRVTIFGESAGGIAVSMLAASPAAKGLFQRAISESGGSFGSARYSNEGGVNVPPLKVAEAAGKTFLDKLGASDMKAARALSADMIQKAAAPGPAAATQFWPVFDGDVLPADQYELYQAKRFNDTPVLIGTNSDEGGLFGPQGMTSLRFEQMVRAGYGKGADAILAVYPHATDTEAAKAGRDLARLDVRVAHVGVGHAADGKRQRQGVCLLLRSSYAAAAERRGPRLGNRVCFQESWRTRSWRGRSAYRAAPRRHKDVRPDEQLLDQLRENRRSQRLRPARVALVLCEGPARDVLRHAAVKHATGAQHRPDQGARCVLRVAAHRSQGQRDALG